MNTRVVFSKVGLPKLGLVGALLFNAAAVNSSEDVLFSFAGQVTQHILTQDYKLLSQWHHYPSRIGHGYASENACQVENNIRDILSEFGELKSLRPLPQRAAFMGIGSASSGKEYWDAKPGAFTFTYEARYEKAGIGILKLEVVDISEKPELKSINFGLYASEEAVTTLQSIAVSVSEARQQRKTENKCQSQIQS